MNCKERLTIKYDGNFVPKELCTIDRNGDADDCEDCGNTCSEHYFDKCEGCPIQKCFDKLGELEDKLENGILIELPCKVGDIAYSYKKCFYLPHATRIKPNAIITCEIIVIKQTKKGIHLLLKPLLDETFGKRSANMWFSLTSIGKTVFLTKEEAEARLKELQNG